MYAKETSVEKLKHLYKELEWEMHENILPFWMNQAVDLENGGFFGRITYYGTAVKNSPKGSVLNARILWTFSAAYNLTGRTEYLDYARRAYNYFSEYFIDKQNGGVVWSVYADGKVMNGRKQVYAQAFAIYALSEFYMADGDKEAILQAIDIYNLIEKFAFDAENNGYIEALSQSWQSLADLRLSEKDANEPKSMNTHLHLLEAYTRLFSIWKDDDLGEKLLNLISLHTSKIFSDNSGHFDLFFDMKWNVKSTHYSFGHDIEGAWLIMEAARVMGITTVIDEAEQLAIRMAKVTLKEGIAADGSLYNEGEAGIVTDTDRHWWPQAEAIIGFINAFEISGNDKFINAASEVWSFIKLYMQHPSGEWWWLVNNEYQSDQSQDLAGEWKCPYHNTRCCIEVIKRVSKLLENKKYPEFVKDKAE
jgi:mannobiose 2-epimerase